MKLIFGLGNYEKKYDNTRHNIGFEYLDYIAKKNNLEFNLNKFKAKYLEMNINNEKVLLIKPETYVNLSGESVIKFVKYFKVDKSNLLIIHDDLDMELGRTKITYNSSSGGHNGIKNIEANLGTKEYLRLKIGIGKNNNIETKDYVLSKFTQDEQKIVLDTYAKLEDLITDFCITSIDNLMNKYNRK